MSVLPASDLDSDLRGEPLRRKPEPLQIWSLCMSLFLNRFYKS